MTSYPMFNQTALFAGEKQPVHHYILVNTPASPLPGLPAGTPAGFAPRGTVVGPITSGAGAQEPRAHQVSVATASDGSQSPKYVLAADVDLTGGPQTVPAYREGEYAYERLFLDPSWNFNLLQQTIQESTDILWDVRQLGILG